MFVFPTILRQSLIIMTAFNMLFGAALILVRLIKSIYYSWHTNDVISLSLSLSLPL